MSTTSDRVNIILSLKNKMGRGLQSASAKLNQFAVRTREAGQAMAIGGAVLGAGLFAVTKVAVDLDDAMRKTQARIAGVTENEMNSLRAMVKELGRTTSFTSAEVAELTAKLAQGGKNAKEIEALTKPMLDLARATGITTEQAAGFTQQALASFKMGVGEAAHVADVLTFAANNSFQGVEDLGEALKFAGPIAEQTGQSFEEVIASMAMMANIGVRGTMAGRSMRKVLVDLADKGSEVAEELGVAIEGVDGKVRALPLILGDFINATKDMSKMDQLQKFNQAFGKIGLNSALISGESAEKIMQLASQLRNLEGTSARTAEIMDGGIGGTLRRLWSDVEGVVVALGESMIPVVDQLSRGLTILAGYLTPILQRMSWLGPALLAVFTVLASGAVVLIGIAAAATVLSATLGALSAAVGFVVAAFGAVASITLPSFLAIAAAAAILALVDWQMAFVELRKVGMKTLKDLLGTATLTVDGMVAAFSSGKMELAFQIAMKGLELAFSESMDNMFGGWRKALLDITTVLTTFFRFASTHWNVMTMHISKSVIRVSQLLGLMSAKVADQMMLAVDLDTFDNINRTVGGINAIQDAIAELTSTSTAQTRKELDELIAKAKEGQNEFLSMTDLLSDIFQDIRDIGDATERQIEEVRKSVSDSIADGLQALRDRAAMTNVTTITRGSIGAFSTAGLQSKLAKAEKDVSEKQLVEQITTNTLLTDIGESIGSFWSN